MKVRILKSSLEGCEGVIKEEIYGDCFIIEFTLVVNNYFQLPCVQVIAKRHVEEVL